MLIIEEAKRKEILEKIKVVKRALPKIEKLIKEGKITVLPSKEEVVIDCLFEKIFQVRLKNSKIIFLVCEYD